MDKIREIRRRAEDAGGGPMFDNYTAEIVVDDSGRTIYLTAAWSSEGYGGIQLLATEEPVFELFRIDNLDENFDLLELRRQNAIELWGTLGEASESPYAAFYLQLAMMITELGGIIEDDSDEDEEPEEE